MTRDPRYDILFESVPIGPVKTRNRFYQVPHCNGMGHTYPKAVAASRAVKAQGGWGVIATEECEIHPSTDVSPHIEARLWDEGDMRRLQLSTEAIHQHGALAAIELIHQGHDSANRYSRLPVMAVTDRVVSGYDPVQAYGMSKRDIADVRMMHRNAAIRAKNCGFDIIYVYAGHDLSLPFHFINPRYNHRTDEYGGSLENRVRFLKELIIDTKECVGDQCAVALRLAVDELLDEDGIVAGNEGREMVEMLAELPDLWDVNISDWSHDSQTSRFSEEGYQEKYISFVKRLTSKPVVGVGRFTSPDTMVSQIKRGVLDLIGAARPSIADPYLPKKIEQGQVDDIRECIGCNICVSGDFTMTPIRCTQNPTMGEEYRRDWHPEHIIPKTTDDSVLIVGGGPAALEAAMSLGKRGYAVTLAEAAGTLGGRVLSESQLPGLGAWKRVVDYRLGQLAKLDSVHIHLNSHLDSHQVIEFSRELGIQHIAIATGAKWRKDGIGRAHHRPIKHDHSIALLSPDDIMGGQTPTGHVIVYDDDHYYMGGVIAEKLVREGARVTLITPGAQVSLWTVNTLEQDRIEQRLFSIGVRIICRHELVEIARSTLRLRRQNSDATKEIDANAAVLVTSRQPQCSLYDALIETGQTKPLAHINTIERIGDCLAPSTIAGAVYHGHRYAREFNTTPDIDTVPFKREYVAI